MTDKEKIKEEIESYKESMKGLEPHSDFRRGQITAYNQIMQFIDSLPEEHNEDLDKLVISLEETIGTSPHSREVIKEHLQKATELQKQKDQETIELAEDHAMLAGMNKMKEEMMENAIEGEIGDIMPLIEVDEMNNYLKYIKAHGLKTGDKVKIIIVKEDK